MTRTLALLGFVLALSAILAGCGGAGGGAPRATVEGIPTPQGVFGQATSVMTPLPAAATAEPAGSGDAVAGKTPYDNKCASCHGAKGEGVEGKGKGVAGWTMSAGEFDDILRTGAKGKLGNEHLFGPSQLSPSGVENLYAYFHTLQKP
jgi:S-disulfanyl-L-cysteine oxidoreductase SoxD